MAIEVQTTQNVTIDYETAGVGYRSLAYVIDVIIIALWALGWGSLIYLTQKDEVADVWESDTFLTLIFTFLFLPYFLYDLLFEALNNGQTPGKMICKIRVVNLDGTAPDFNAYFLRWLFRPIDFASALIVMMPGMLAFIMILTTKNAQRLGDIMAKTTVIDLKPTSLSKELRITDLDFRDDYKVTFPDVLDRLSDKDLQTIISILDDPKMSDNDFFIRNLSNRVKALTNYNADMNDKAFLSKVINDYKFLAIQ